MKKSYFLLSALLCLGLLSTQAQINDILPFTSTNGAYPYGSLTLSGKVLYGMTYQGGLYSQGCVFAVDTNGNNYRDLLDLHDTTGEEPRGSLLLADGFLYGMTTLGGSTNQGNLFRVDTGGNNYKNLLDFNNSKGTTPWGSLIMLGGNLYGMAQGGGAANLGVIFSIDTDGSNYKTVFSFGDTGTRGYGPEGDLIFVNGRFYGMTEDGGVNFNGVIFSVDSNGHGYKDLVDFGGDSIPMGQYPKGSLTYANGMLYGMVQQGGTIDYGVAFSVDTNGQGYKVLVDFTGTNGYDPVGNFLLRNGTLFGMTFAGGASLNGNIFSIDTSGNNYNDIIDFNGSNGKSPAGTLTFANGILYGTTYQGGPLGNYGVVFSTNICNLTVSVDTLANDACYGGNTGIAIATINQGNAPYTFQWGGGAGTGDTATALSAGSYTLSVTDADGCSSTASYTITQPTQLQVTDSIQNVSCFGAGNGSIALSLSGGTPPFTYTWSPNAGSSATILAIAAGTYVVTITDNNGCTTNSSYTVTQPSSTLNISTDSVAQIGQLCNGIAAVTVSGGTAPYTYLWQTGGQTTDTITGQCAGTFCCLITDSNGCSQNTCVTINLGTGINGLESGAVISVYPEPNNGEFTIEGISSGQVIDLYAYNGQKLSSAIACNTTLHFNISDKANGIYLIRIIAANGNAVSEQKVVKM